MVDSKIGILTFHDTINFGAILQTVATYKAICSLGCKCEIINYHNRNIDEREIPEIFLKKSYKNLKFLIQFLFRDYKLIKKHKRLLKFLEKECLISKNYYNKDNIKNVATDYKTILVGSDMLWCTKYTLSDYTYMLDFVDAKTKKYAFATSLGFEWSESEKAKIKPLIQQFDKIALREKDSCSFVGSILNKKISWVCDPTMLIEPNEWLNYVKAKPYNDYVIVYMDDFQGNCLKAAREYSRINNAEIRVSGIEIDFDPRSKDYKYANALSIEDFLTSIKHANMLFTASYHGMLFAIYFHIPFVYYNKDSSRLNSVAERLDLLNRNGNLYNPAEMSDINWEKVDKKREEFRLNSLNILKEMIVK